MKIDTSALVTLTEANQDFSKVAQLVDERGSAVITKNNKPRYKISIFNEINEPDDDDDEFNAMLNDFIQENREALTALAAY